MEQVSTDNKPRALRDDILWGGQAIADEAGITLQQLYYLIRKKRVRVRHLGPKTIITTKKELKRDLAITAD
jgi:hypothetical protein